MKKFSGFLLLAALLAAGCGKMGYRYTSSGLKYKIISKGGKDSLKQGDMIKLFFEQRIEDSVLMSSSDAGYQMATYDTNWAKQSPYSVAEIMPLMKIGDSAVCVMKVDTILAKFFKGAPADQIPSFLKKGRNMYAHLRIVRKYTDTAEFRKDQEAEALVSNKYREKMQQKAMEDQKKKDEAGFATARAEFDKFMGDRKSKLQKTASGVYVEIMEPGNGPACDSGKQVSVRYRGTLLDGTEFDGNFEKPTDTIKKPVFNVVMGQPGAIQGFMEGLAALRKGARAKIYMPAETGYGGQQMGEKIKPYSNLIFELFIEDVTTPKPMGKVEMAPPPPPPPPAKGGKDDHAGHNH